MNFVMKKMLRVARMKEQDNQYVCKKLQVDSVCINRFTQINFVKTIKIKFKIKLYK